MIILPTRQRLLKRREALRQHLDRIVDHASVHQVEDLMRKIHQINFKLIHYFGKNEKDSVDA